MDTPPQQEELASRPQADGSDRPLDEILRVLAHALRNPLGAINVAAAVLKRRIPDDPATRKQIEIIQRAVEKMNRLIDGTTPSANDDG